MRKLVLLALFMPGCNLFNAAKDAVNDIKDTIEGLVNPLVVEGLILGVEAPDSQLIDLGKLGLDEGTTGTVFLADAKNIDEIENAPVEDATVVLEADQDFTAQDQGEGVYTLADEAITYDDDGAWSVRVSVPGEDDDAMVHFALPSASAIQIEDTHPANTAMPLNFGAEAFDAVLVVVYDAASGSVTFSNEPEGVKEYYDLARGQQAPVESIPGTAFPSQGVYAVGIAGLESSKDADVDNANTLLSTMMAGKMKFYPVTVTN